MKKRPSRSLFLSLAALSAALLTPLLLRAAPQSTPASPSDYTNPNPDRYLFEDQLKPGMKGYGLTVMRGGKIERFNVEILDIMKNFNPGKNAILVKCTGLGLEESGIIAGMSGSPCYIDGKLIGAVAFGWGGAKQPIGGVQPIRQMLAIPADPKSTAQAPAGSARWTTDSALTRAALAQPGWDALARHMAARSGRPIPLAHATLTPLATPLMISSASPQALAYIQDMLAHTGLVPMQSGAAGGNSGAAPRLGGLRDTTDAQLKLAPGSAVAIPLLSGDMDLAAIGTITDVDGNKIWAFGHAMFADGPSQLPIATSYIYSILPSISTSFKIGATVAPAGTLAADENTGIVGFTGPIPKTIPLTLTILSAAGAPPEIYHYQLVSHPRLTAEVLATALAGTIIAQRNLPHQYTLDLTGSAQFAGAQLPLRSLSTSDHFDIADILLPVAALTDNPYHNLPLEKLDLTATIAPANHSADLRRIHLDRLTVAPGQTLTATIEYAPFQKPVESRTLSIPIPADTPEGDCDLIIGSARAMRASDLATAPYIGDPENVAALLASIKQITSYPADHLFARLVFDVDGAAAAGQPRRNLPATRLALLSSDRQTGITPIYRTLTTDIPTDAIFDDVHETLHITIAKDADKRYHQEPIDLTPSNPPPKTKNPLTPKHAPIEPEPLE